MRCLRLAIVLLAIVPLASVHAAPELPALDLSITKFLGTTRQEEIMLNRIVPYAGAHVGGVHVDTHSSPPRFYIFDSANNRVLGFLGFKPADLANQVYGHADIVIGQHSMWDCGSANGDNLHFLPPRRDTLALLPFPYVSSTAEAPRSGMMATDASNNFYIVDLCNNRVLKYNDPFATDQLADEVWGQTTFTNRSPNNGLAAPPATASNLYTQWIYGSTLGAFSAGVDVDAAGNVWVADSRNSRVLRFPAGAKVADLVIGQQNFNSRLEGSSLNQMHFPTGVRLHPQTGELLVLDGQMDWGVCRLLVFKPPFSTGMSAVRAVAGRVDTQASGLNWARGFCIDPFESNIVWIADGGNDRIVKVNYETGALLDVIGQPNLTTLMGVGKYVRPDGSVADFRQPDGSISIDNDHNLYFGSFYGMNKVMRIPLPIRRNPQGVVWSSGEMLRESMNQISGRTMNDNYGCNRWGDQLYVCDGPRMLVWTNYRASATFAHAAYVVGQDSFERRDQPGGPLGAGGGQITTGSNFVFVACDWSTRIVVCKAPITGGGKNYPYLKILQSGNGSVKWDDNGGSVTFSVNGLVYDAVGNCLWISDYNRNRILRIRDPLGVARVDLVLGQTNKTDGARNHGLGLWTTDARGFGAPWSLGLDNFRNLYVVDSGFEGREDNSGNLRVTRFDYTNTVPVTNNIFPFYAASGVFGKPNLTTPRTYHDAHRPGIPTYLTFNASNHMALLCDSYGNPQGELVFYYPTPHVGTTPQPSHIITTFFGQPAAGFFDGDLLVLHDHTWNRVVFHAPHATAPYIDITNDNITVVGALTTSIGGTNNANVVGGMRWSDTAGNGGNVAAGASWSVAGIPLAYGGNLITIVGTNATGIVASDTVTITRDYADGDGPPQVVITNAPHTVPHSASTTALGGYINRHVVGMLACTNNRGGTANTPATLNWTITGLPLATGTNIITVTGGNAHDSNATATLILVREMGDGEGEPVVTITTPDAVVDDTVTNYTINGVNNQHVVGGMWWANSMGGNGTLPAAPSWSIAGIQIVPGPNIITVTGTNAFGITASDSVTIFQDVVITDAFWQTLTVTNGTGYSGAGTGMRMNERDTLVKNYDGDPYLYIQAHASAGNPCTQSIWRVPASVPASLSQGAWQMVIGGIPVNSSGGEPGQTWLKYSNVFYSSMWCQFGVPNGGPWYWSWYGFHTTNRSGARVVAGLTPGEPVVTRATGDSYPGGSRNIGGIITWTNVAGLTAICTDRNDGGSGEDAQVRSWHGMNTLATVSEQQCEGVHTMYAASAFDAHENGRGLFLDCRTSSGENWVWMATNLLAGANNIQNAHRLLQIPGNNTAEAVVDMVPINYQYFFGYTLLAVSVWTDGARKLFLYNVDRPDLAPIDITPATGAHQWRNRLAAYEAYVFYSYDAGGERPGVMRLSLLNYDLRPLGIPEPAGAALLLLGALALRRRHAR